MVIYGESRTLPLKPHSFSPTFGLKTALLRVRHLHQKICQQRPARRGSRTNYSDGLCGTDSIKLHPQRWLLKSVRNFYHMPVHEKHVLKETRVTHRVHKTETSDEKRRSLLTKSKSDWLVNQLAANSRSRCRIVLTGGPGGGKTTAADLFRREIGEKVVIVPESATLLFSGGFPRSTEPRAAAAAQEAIFHVQRQLEEVQSFLYPDRILLCDGGTIDGAAYCLDSPDKFFSSLNTSFEAKLARYDGVIFFESAAVGGLTIEGGNPIRNESLRQAVALDARLRELWMHHPHFILVRHNASFFKKIALGLAELDNMVNEFAADREKETTKRASRPRP